jgi:hypothetical protein
MENNIEPYQVAQAATAFALPSLLQLCVCLRALRINWPQFICWLCAFCVGIAVAVPFGLARGGHLPHPSELFLAWKYVSVMSSQAFEVIMCILIPDVCC